MSDLIRDGLEDVTGRDVAPLLARGIARLFDATSSFSSSSVIGLPCRRSLNSFAGTIEIIPGKETR